MYWNSTIESIAIHMRTQEAKEQETDANNEEGYGSSRKHSFH